MKLTENQTTTIKKLEETLSEFLWGEVYYGKNPNQEVISLFKEGVELNFEVKLLPYVGRNHPEGDEVWGER